jgi:hypothetical protein
VVLEKITSFNEYPPLPREMKFDVVNPFAWSLKKLPASINIPPPLPREMKFDVVNPFVWFPPLPREMKFDVVNPFAWFLKQIAIISKYHPQKNRLPAVFL